MSSDISYTLTPPFGPMDLVYDTGHVNGTIVADNISIAGLPSVVQLFAITDFESVGFFQDPGFDGILGLSLPVSPKHSLSGSASDLIFIIMQLESVIGVPNLLINMASQGLIKSSVILYRLSLSDCTGEITLVRVS